MRFCEWLTKKTGRRFTLPTEAQWEYACRAGTATPQSYGATDANFGPWANLADRRVEDLCRGDSPKWIPAVMTVDDGAIVTQEVGRYRPNAWGLHDLHGNASEWTLTTYRPYPHVADGRDSGRAEGRKVVRGGSFYDRPARARSAFRLSYPPWQCVFNVGFRVAVTDDPAALRVSAVR
jgi:formylglycine-generating enzyme required for sulfatase activity